MLLSHKTEHCPSSCSASSICLTPKLIQQRCGRGVKISDPSWVVPSSSPVPLKTRHIGELCTLNLSRLKRPQVGVVVRRRGDSSGVVLVTGPWFKIARSVAKSPRVAEQSDVNIYSLTLQQCLAILVLI
ncbi:uncharacterized protein TNCV_4471211 [Trichonephila clavipes]|uniref:Uncharacterized protein n=1 Tax=Trichonephila clavipes TaxID=2585209 RepID=A0A8X6VLV1_TRICX|nr:uncharacterized protein TNCV_4471211 [Trichonephila clavipes]